MAREVIVKTWCDLCLASDSKTEADELPPIQLPHMTKPRVLALCEVHTKELYTPLLELLRKHGQPVPPKDTPAGRMVPHRGVQAQQEPLVAVSAPVTRAGVPQTVASTTTDHQGRVRRVWRSEGDASCPVPGCDWTNGTRSACDQHAKKAHGETLPVLEGRHGQVTPTGDRVQPDHQCPHCDAAYSKAGPLTVHRHQAHGAR